MTPAERDEMRAGLARSNLASVRNPILSLPAASKFASLPPEAQALLVELIRDIRNDARERAQKSWKQNKGPMAAYWKAVGAYCHHIYRAASTLGAKDA